MKKLLISIFLVSLISCSSLSKNAVVEGHFVLKGGVFGDQEWEDELVFKRTSWFKELTLYFDFIAAKVDQNSPFYQWFSEMEKAAINECVDYFVAVTYAFKPRDISVTMFKEEMKKYGYMAQAVPRFEQNLNMHPDFSRFNINLYNTYLYCRTAPSKGLPIIQFPGFKKQNFQY